MARQARRHADGGWHHVFNRGTRRWAIFETDSDRSAFVALLAQMRDEHDVEVHAFCLVGNHYHLLVRDTLGNLGRAMGYLGQVYTQQFNAARGVDGPVFRGRFGSEPITSDRQLLTTVSYISRNAFDLGFDNLDDYRWSSHRSYADLRATPPWLKTDEVLALVGGVEGYRALLAEPESADGQGAPLALELVERVVLSATRRGYDSLMTAERGTTNLPRLLLVLAAAELTPFSHQEVASIYGFRSASSVRTAVRRARKLRSTDRSFAELWKAVAQDTLGSVPSVS